MILETYMIWLLGGVLAGGLAGFALKRGGYGVVGDVLFGLGGGIVGSWIWPAIA